MAVKIRLARGGAKKSSLL